MQPDTVIPDLSNPQSWNRFSYTLNSPINFADPTGHSVACDPYEDDCHHDPAPTNPAPPLGNNGNSGGGNGGPNGGCQGDPNCELGGGGGSGGNPDANGCYDTNGNGVVDIPCPGLTTRAWGDGFNRLGSPDPCPKGYSLLECYYLHGSIEMGQDPMYISREDFLDLLQAIYYEVHGRDPADLIVSSMGYDTPFYDHGRLGGLGAWPGTACIEGVGCFARHEINYIAQGEISAAAGETKMEGLFRVVFWKAGPGILHIPSDGTFYMWKIGYIYYHGVNGSIPPP